MYQIGSILFWGVGWNPSVTKMGSCDIFGVNTMERVKKEVFFITYIHK